MVSCGNIENKNNIISNSWWNKIVLEQKWNNIIDEEGIYDNQENLD